MVSEFKKLENLLSVKKLHVFSSIREKRTKCMAVGRYSPLSKVDYRFLSVVAKMFFLRKRDEVVWQFNVERCVEV